MRRFPLLLTAVALLMAASAPVARATAARDRGAIATLVSQISSQYTSAFPSHAPGPARTARTLAGAAENLAAARSPRARALAAELTHALAATSERFEVWPLPDDVTALTRRLASALAVNPSAATARPTAAMSEVRQLVDTAGSQPPAAAAVTRAEAWAVFAQSLAPRLSAVAPQEVSATESDLLSGAQGRLAGDLHDDAASLGQIKVSRATIVSDAAIILFREGLEAVLILAAITASFTGARRRLRRLVLAGAGVGLLATAVTYVLAQALIDALGDGGLRLQAITGILAIVVLLIVTNWFFHKLYWSEWISRFNRRRRTLEKVDRLGFISGQSLGFIILGLTSVYREGFETVLFLQNLQVSAGTSATLLGVGIGLAATLIVGAITFALGRKLPYRKMLILTGVLIGLVLAVMVGTTVNNLQGLGWLPSDATGFTVDPRLSQWIGLYGTWEGIGAQIGALVVVYGSYALARQIQGRRRRRAIAATDPAQADAAAAAAVGEPA